MRTLPIPTLEFFSVPRVMSRYAATHYSEERDEETSLRNMRIDEMMSGGIGGF